jgi:uroporphyrin-III C-methyltransferase/precorrin-2 dehydrogenase/sirohydrochlorin ferrochelatase
MTRHYVACVDLRGRNVLVVGGGRVALEKAQGLLDCGARVTVVAPEVCDELAALQLRTVRRPFVTSDVDGQLLVVAATNDREVNRRVSAAATAQATLCNVADDPELCSFILPALVRRDPIVLPSRRGRVARTRAAVARRDRGGRAPGACRAAPGSRRCARAKRELPTYEARRDYSRGSFEASRERRDCRCRSGRPEADHGARARAGRGLRGLVTTASSRRSSWRGRPR